MSWQPVRLGVRMPLKIIENNRTHKVRTFAVDSVISYFGIPKMPTELATSPSECAETFENNRKQQNIIPSEPVSSFSMILFGGGVRGWRRGGGGGGGAKDGESRGSRREGIGVWGRGEGGQT